MNKELEGTAMFLIAKLATDNALNYISKIVFVEPRRNTLTIPDTHPPDLKGEITNKVVFENGKIPSDVAPVPPKLKSALTDWGLLNITYTDNTFDKMIQEIMTKFPNDIKVPPVKEVPPPAAAAATAAAATAAAAASAAVLKKEMENEKQKVDEEKRKIEEERRQFEQQKLTLAREAQQVKQASKPKAVSVAKVSGVVETDPTLQKDGSYVKYVIDPRGQGWKVSGSKDDVIARASALNDIPGPSKGPYINKGNPSKSLSSENGDPSITYEQQAGGGQKYKTMRASKRRYKDTR